ncbi:MAG: M28 family metallopeptidase [bacterium]
MAAIAMASAFLELLFLPHVIRWILPKKQSQNVYAIAKAQSIARQKIVLVAHVDSHRTPLIWHSPLTYKIYRLMSTLGMVAFTGLFLSMLICFLVNHEIASYLSALCGFFILLVLIMTLQAELSSFTKGANDNASGAGIVLALAEKFAQAPLLHSEIWFVFTGCEEVGAHGSFDFVKKQRHELGKAKFIAIDNIAGKDTAPRYYVSETLLRKMKYPKEMIDLVRSVADENPEFDAKPYSQRGVYTDGTPFLLSGIPGIAVVGHREDGWIPDWHSKTDTFENVDSHALSRAQGFIEKLVERMDENV